jgi:hypothetical protein
LDGLDYCEQMTPSEFVKACQRAFNLAFGELAFNAVVSAADPWSGVMRGVAAPHSSTSGERCRRSIRADS